MLASLDLLVSVFTEKNEFIMKKNNLLHLLLWRIKSEKETKDKPLSECWCDVV